MSPTWNSFEAQGNAPLNVPPTPAVCHGQELVLPPSNGGSSNGEEIPIVRSIGIDRLDNIYKVVPQFVSVQLVNISPISLWFIVDILSLAHGL